MFLKMKLKFGQHLGKNAQVTLELTFSIICAFLLFFACITVFIWIHKCFVVRQVMYEDTRGWAATKTDATPVIVDDSNWNLTFFNKQ